MTRVLRSAAAAAAAAAGAAVAAHDVLQREHALLRNFPVIGHARYLLEAIGPELRQYVVAGNDEERPFSRDQRRWVYASAKLENNYFGFGTDNDIEHTAGYPIIKHRTFGRAVPPSRAARRRRSVGCRARRCSARRAGGAARSGPTRSSTSPAMSFGSLSGAAVEALNRGRGAGRVPAEHRRGRAVARTTATAASWSSRSARRTSAAATSRAASTWRGSRTSSPPRPVRALEIKLSQGAKPGLGGAAARRRRCPRRSPPPAASPQGEDCVSPSRHAEFSDADSLLDWVELLAAETGLPVGIKSAVGDLGFWEELADLMARDRARRRLRDRRRRRGRHRRGAADLHRLGVAAVPARLRPRLPDLRRARPARAGRVRRRRQARPARQRRRRVRPRLRHGQRRPRGDARDRLHPGAEVPHRQLPDRRGDAERVAGPRPRPGAQVGAGGELRQDPAPRPAEGGRGVRRRAPGADRRRRRRDARRPDRRRRPLREVYGYAARLGPAVGGGPGRASYGSWPASRTTPKAAALRPRRLPWGSRRASGPAAGPPGRRPRRA